MTLGLSAGASLRAESVFRVCDDVEQPASLNPYQVFSEKTLTIIQQALEGLVRFDPKGEIEPALAERWERIDAYTMRFHLRGGVRFQNGETLDAEAVKFSLEKYAAPETAYPGRGFVTLSKIVVVDPHIVDVVTQAPDGLLLNRLSLFGHIVPPEYYRKVGAEGFAKHPIGTGAFQFENWKKGKEISFTAYKGYWMEALPRVDRLVFYFLEPKEQIRRLLAGELELVTEIPGTETLKIQSSSVARVLKMPSLYTVAGSFNTAVKPLDDLRVRQALNYAIDKRELIRYDLLGNGSPIHTLALKGHEAVVLSTGLTPFDYNPGLARQLLKSAGAEKLKLSILEVKAPRTASIIAQHWKRVGVEASVASTTDAMVKTDIAKKSWDVFIGGCPDPMYHSFFIQSIFLYSRSPYSLIRDSELDAMIGKVVEETDPGAHLEKSARLAAYVNERALTIFTYQRIKTHGVSRGVEFEPAISGMPYFRSSALARMDHDRH